MSKTYEIGNALFRDLRAFLDSADVDPSTCKLTITLPDPGVRSKLVEALRWSAPPLGDYGRISSAQAGNYGGTWQGVRYQFDVASPGKSAEREAGRREGIEEAFRAGWTARDDRASGPLCGQLEAAFCDYSRALPATAKEQDDGE